MAAFNPGDIIVLGAVNRDNGTNAKDRLDGRHSQEITIYLRQKGCHENKCVWFAACLCVHLQCPDDAKMMQISTQSKHNDH